MFAWLALAFMAGWVIPLQTAANGNLKRQMRSPFLASFVNCTIGAGILSVLILATGESITRPLDYLLSLEWWLYLSGSLGAVILIVAILLSARLGMLGTSLATMTGMMVSGLVFDASGFFGIAMHPFGLMRAAALLMMLLGLALALNLPHYLKQHGHKLSMASLGWFVVGCTSGTLLTTQGAINAIARVKFDSVLWCAWLSMVMTALIVLIIALTLRQSPQRLLDIEVKGRYWIFIGGFMGATNIIAAALFIPLIGAGTLMTLSVAGQLCCALLMDHIGMWELEVRRIQPLQLVGLGLIILAVALIRLL